CNAPRSLRLQGKYEEAGPLPQRAVAIAEKVYGPDHPRVGVLLNYGAALLKIRGKYDQAEPLYKKTQGIFDKSLGRDHPNVATILNINNPGLLSICSSAFLALTTFLLQLYATFQGKYEEAGPLCERSLAICEKALGPDHPDVAQSLNTRAQLLREQVR
ncbi:unnamed protein product, partial [Laminaria digitata]